MSVEPTHGVYQPTGSPALDLSWDDLLPIDYLQLTGGSTYLPSRQRALSPADAPLANTADAMLLSFSRLSAMLFISQLLACLGCADVQVRRQSSSMK